MRITLTTLSRPEDGSHFRLLEAGKIRRGQEIGCSSKSTYLFVHQDDSLGEVLKSMRSLLTLDTAKKNKDMV